jgi:hypothetical protein
LTIFKAANSRTIGALLTRDRIRRVKCDETKPKCIRCGKFGRICDGYEIKTICTPQPTAPKPSSRNRQLLPITLAPLVPLHPGPRLPTTISFQDISNSSSPKRQQHSPVAFQPHYGIELFFKLALMNLAYCNVQLQYQLLTKPLKSRPLPWPAPTKSIINMHYSNMGKP